MTQSTLPKLPDGAIQTGIGRFPTKEIADSYAKMEQVFSTLVEQDPDDVAEQGGYRVIYFKKPGSK